MVGTSGRLRQRGVGAEISGGNFWDGFRNGAITSTLNHVAHQITDKITRAQKLARQHQLNEDRIVAESIVMEAILETTEIGDIVQKARELYAETYATKSAKNMSEDFSVVMDVIKSYGDSFGSKSTSIAKYKIVAGLAADILVLQTKNLYLGYKVKSLAPNVYYQKINPVGRPMSYGGGGSKGKW